MLTLTARAANRNFARVIRAAAAGEEVLITRRGVPVAKVVPVPSADDAAAEREAAIVRLRKRMATGLHLPGREALDDAILAITPCGA